MVRLAVEASASGSAYIMKSTGVSKSLCVTIMGTCTISLGVSAYTSNSAVSREGSQP